MTKILQVKYCYSEKELNRFLKKFIISDTGDISNIVYLPLTDANSLEGDMQSKVVAIVQYFKKVD